MDRRTFVKATAGAALLATVGTGRTHAQTTGLNFVLVAGAFAGGWIWTRVADRLRREHHRVFTPSLAGLADRAHLLSRDTTLETFIQDIVGVIEAEELSDVILVGSSFGGVPISGVADRIPNRIRHLVYVDALIVEPGKSLMQILPPPAADALRKRAQETSAGLTIPLPPPANVAALGLNDADVAWCLRRYTPHPLASYEAVLNVKNPIGNNLPGTYIACLNPDFAAIRSSRALAKGQPGWRWIEMQTGHLPMVSASDALTSTLIQVTTS